MQRFESAAPVPSKPERQNRYCLIVSDFLVPEALPRGARHPCFSSHPIRRKQNNIVFSCVYINNGSTANLGNSGSVNNRSTMFGIFCSSAKNFHLIRYADVLLWYAEVLIHDGKYAEAGKYINMVRARAANDYVRAVDPNTMEESSSSYVFDDIVDGTKKTDAAANYRLGLYPDSPIHYCGRRDAGSSMGTPHRDGA